jgi:hypothetical protein
MQLTGKVEATAEQMSWKLQVFVVFLCQREQGKLRASAFFSRSNEEEENRYSRNKILVGFEYSVARV